MSSVAPFQLCINTSTIRCADAPALTDKIDVAARAGFAGIEPWVQELDAFVDGGGALRELAGRIHDAGLTVCNLIGFFEWAVPDETRRAAGIAAARKAFAYAQALDCTCVAAPPSGINTETGLDLRAIAARYAALIDVGREYGVTPVVEFWGAATTLGTLGEALLIAAESGRAEACVLADIFHMYKGTGHFEGLQLLGPASLGLVHVNDYPAAPPRATIGDADRVYPGDGVAPYPRIMQALHRAGYRGVLSLELFNRSYWAQPAFEVAVTGFRKLTAATAAAQLPA